MQQKHPQPQETLERGQFSSAIPEEEDRIRGRFGPVPGAECCPACGQQMGYAPHHAGHPGSIVHLTPVGIALMAIVPAAVGMLVGFLLAAAREH